MTDDIPVWVCACYEECCRQRRSGNCEGRMVPRREAVAAAQAWAADRTEFPGWRCVAVGGKNYSEPEYGDFLARDDGSVYGVACGEIDGILIPCRMDPETYYGYEFVRDVDAAIASTKGMRQEEYDEGSWRDLPPGYGYISVNHGGAVGTVVVGIEPHVARRLRDGYLGSDRIHFAMLASGEFAILIEHEFPAEGLSAIHYAAFDFPGGRRAVYSHGN